MQTDDDGMTSLTPGAALSKLNVLTMIHGIQARQFRSAERLVDRAHEQTRTQRIMSTGLKVQYSRRTYAL